MVSDARETDYPAVSLQLPRGHLPATIRLATPLDDDELYELTRRYSDLRIERASDGALIVMPPTGGETGKINFVLTARVAAWVEQDGTGVGFDSSTAFRLPNGAARSPDIAWIRKTRWQGLTDEERRKFPPLCPDFVVELRSPSDALETVEAKMDEYRENGALLGWLIDPLERRVHVYRCDQPTEVLENPGSLSGESVLRGFELTLADIW